MRGKLRRIWGGRGGVGLGEVELGVWFFVVFGFVKKDYFGS